MHKIVNGKQVEMTLEEEQAFIAEQELAAQRNAEKKAIADAKAEQMSQCWDKVFTSANLTDEEKKMLKQCLGIQ